MVVSNPNLEQAVRPFQSRPWLTPFPQTTPPAVLPPVDAPSESVSASEQFQGLEWGDPLDSQFASTGISGFKTTDGSKQTETARTSTKKRVTNPDDPTQFVDLDIMNDITFFDSQAQTYIKQVLNNK